MTSAEPTASTPGQPPLRPRYARLAAFAASVSVTFVTFLGGVGMLPAGGVSSYAASSSGDTTGDASGDTATLSAAEPRDDSSSAAGGGAPEPTPTAADLDATGSDEVPVPPDSGEGKRVVFSISQQRVWLVDEHDEVERTYLVSGSVHDNLAPGVYEVFSRSKYATGIQDSGTMRYMVRFAHGRNAAIGFHDIPVHDGRRVQSRAELGTPTSHGCVRQWRQDAKDLWRFAPRGTEVTVTA